MTDQGYDGPAFAPTRTPTPTIPWYPWRQVWIPLLEVYR